MAYMNQEKKAKFVPEFKKLCKKYGIKGTLAVHNHSTIVANLAAGSLDFIGNYIATNKDKPWPQWDKNAEKYLIENQYMDVNPYHFQNHFTGKCLQFLTELVKILNTGNHNNSDIMSDYFDIGWYVDINVGKWNKPYNYTK